MTGYVIRADKKREDVASQCGIGINHGFADTIYTECTGEKRCGREREYQQQHVWIFR